MKHMNKFLCLLLVLAMVLSTALTGCSEKEQESGAADTTAAEESTESGPKTYEECETAWEMNNNLTIGWNLGCSLSPYFSTNVENFVALLYYHDDCDGYNRSIYTNYFDATSHEVEVEWSIEDEEGIVKPYEDALICDFGIEIWNFALSESDTVSIDVMEYYLIMKDGSKLQLDAGKGVQSDVMSGGTGAYSLITFDPELKLADVAGAYCKLHFEELKSESSASAEQVEYYETCWGNPVTTQEMIDAVAAKGFNIIRPQVSWVNHMDSEGNLEPLWLERVAEVVDYCMNAGVYCIINTTGCGWLEATEENYAANSEKYKKVWAQIAERFKDYGELLIFESFNELLWNNHWGEPAQEGYDVIAKLHQDFVDTVRAAGGYNATRNLCLNTYATAYSYYMTSKFNLPEDTVEGHLFAQVHCYEPNQFTFNETNLGSTDFTNEWGTEAEYERIIDIMDEIRQRFIEELNIPVIIGEFGVVDRAPESERVEWATHFVKSASERGIKLIYFDDGGDFTLFDRRNLTWKYTKLADALVNNWNQEIIPWDEGNATVIETQAAEETTAPAETEAESTVSYIEDENWQAVVALTDSSWTYGRIADAVKFDKETKTAELTWKLEKTEFFPNYDPEKDITDFLIELWNFNLGEKVKTEKTKIKIQYEVTRLEYTTSDGQVISCDSALKTYKDKLSAAGTMGSVVYSFSPYVLQGSIVEVRATVKLLGEY